VASIFISYRREDSAAYAGRLRDHLRQHFGKAEVFMDIDTIDLGQAFDAAIQEAVGACDILIAVIGPQWSTISDENGQRRLEHDGDFIRLEVATALERNIPVIPMLVGGAKMPAAEDLPDNLKSLSVRNALSVTNERWDYDIGRLVKAMDRVVDDGHGPELLRNPKLWASVAAVAVVAAGAYWFLTQSGDSSQTGLTPDFSDFGDVQTGRSSEPGEIIFTNASDAAIIIWGLALTSGDEFLIEDDGCSAKAVGPGTQCTILTRFRPSSAGDKKALLLAKNEDGETLGHAELQGSGVAPAASPTPAPATAVTVVLPETSGVEEARAMRKLLGMCQPTPCLEVEVTTVASDTVPQGEVLGTRPGSGASVERGSRVTLVVSSGPAVVAEQNNFRNFRAMPQSDQEVLFTADYNYIGDFESNTPPIRLSVRDSDNNVIPGMVYRYDIAEVGTGKTTLNAYADFGGGMHVSETVRLCLMDVSRRTRGFCESFPFQNRWLGTHGSTRGRRNAIFDFRPQDPTRNELKVTVNYIYDGSLGFGSNEVYMFAVARGSDGNQLPRTHFEGLGGPGEVRVGIGTSTMLINRKTDQLERSVDVRVCITRRGDSSRAICEIFPHHKTWR